MAGRRTPLEEGTTSSEPEGRNEPLSARFSEAPAGPGSLQTEFVLVLTCPAQLSTSIVRLAVAKAIATLLSKAPASSSSLQAELVLVLACPAETSTILRKARSWKRREQQARRSKSNRCQLIHFNRLSVVLLFASMAWTFAIPNDTLAGAARSRHGAWGVGIRMRIAEPTRGLVVPLRLRVLRLRRVQKSQR